MSTLRPIDPETGATKKYEDYSDSERLHAVLQIEDDHKNAQAVGRKLDDATIALAHRLSKGTDKENNVDLPKPTLGLKN